jgi:hypothetical protein
LVYDIPIVVAVKVPGADGHLELGFECLVLHLFVDLALSNMNNGGGR